jgi:hypothetical protein
MDELLALHFSNAAYFGVHRLFVDSYCLQHPDRYCASFKSLAAHLAHLCWSLEHQGSRAIPSEAIRRWVERHSDLEKPVLPAFRGVLTIGDVAKASDPGTHHRAVQEWAWATWEANADLQSLARDWVKLALEKKGAGDVRESAGTPANTRLHPPAHRVAAKARRRRRGWRDHEAFLTGQLRARRELWSSVFRKRKPATMEPNLVTDPKILDVLNELIRRELIFHRPEFGSKRADFESMIEATFWEVGASGRRYSREYVLDALEKRHANQAEDAWQTRDFHCLEIAVDNYLLTYTVVQSARVTRRSTIWRRTVQGWKIVYHQGTVVEDR